MSELTGGLDAQLRAESVPQLAIGSERVHRATGLVQRSHQEFHDGFFERLLGRHRFEVADHVGVAALCDAGLGQRAPRQQVAPFETAGLDLDEGFVAQVGERTTPPEPQRLLEQRLTRGRIPRQRIAREVHETIELVHVDVGGFEVEHVPGRRGRDQRALIGAVGLQQAAQFRHLIRNGPDARVGSVVTPNVVQQTIR